MTLHSMEAMMKAGCTSRRGVRHWEGLGLLGDVARTEGETRRYTDDQLERAAIIACGQFGGFDLETIAGMIAEYHTSAEARDALLTRLSDQMRAAARLAENLPPARIPGVVPMKFDL